MVKRIGGKRRKSRAKIRRPSQERGRIPITKHMQTFEEGEKVQLKAEPSYQAGLYHLDFHGKVGIIAGKQGTCYRVAITDGKKVKNLIVHPVHLKRLMTSKKPVTKAKPTAKPAKKAQA
ncbi:50S ribosomal protein L21e [Candidatus Woesearchaeota archaeon]|nr:50S ribosomal protein L21e [Candidatus Woesearchaeota archaeon]